MKFNKYGIAIVNKQKRINSLFNAQSAMRAVIVGNSDISNSIALPNVILNIERLEILKNLLPTR